MYKKILIILFIAAMIITVILTLFLVEITGDYEYISNIELINITNAAYIQGALYTSQTGIIPFIENGTIQTTTIEEQCKYLNKQGVKQ